tara:strand:+ start:4 stop:486 length:483 start_codon:yes stop_codon:yes gene_type:complete
MSEYKIGKVYKIMYIGNENISITYIGSTMNTLRNKWYYHGKQNGCSIYPYFEEFGIDNFKIFLIKEYKVYDRKHLLMYEQLYINKLNCININNPFQPLRNEQRKEYSINNKDKNREDNRKYRENNKDKIKERKKQYYIDNKDKFQQYYIDNKDKSKKKNT